MENRKSKIAIVAIVIAFFASAFASCNIYEKEELEIRRCPQVQDTVIMPGWDEMER